MDNNLGMMSWIPIGNNPWSSLYSISFTRTLHPVGHGGFFTEGLKDSKQTKVFQAIYDCGTQNSQDILKNCIDSAFAPQREIDILFISHLDQDHISGIEYLKSKHTIKRILFPFQKEDLIFVFLQALETAKETNNSEPSVSEKTIFDFFSYTKFWKSSDSNEDAPVFCYMRPYGSNEFQQERKSIEQLQNGEEIDSFQELSFSTKQILWKYVPFVFDERERQKEFNKRVKEEKEKEDSPLKDFEPQHLFGKENKKIIDKLKEIYNQIGKGTRNINSNSMMLYSGPFRPGKANYFVHQESKQKGNLSWETPYYYPACLYLGDVDLDKQPTIPTIKFKLSNDLANLGMIQIPHHGSKGSFNRALLDLGCHTRYYFLSHRANDKKHPSVCVKKNIYSHQLLCISENPETRYQITFTSIFKTLQQ